MQAEHPGGTDGGAARAAGGGQAGVWSEPRSGAPQEGPGPQQRPVHLHSRSLAWRWTASSLVKGREKGGGGMRPEAAGGCGPLVRRASWHSLVSGSLF